MNDLRIYIIMRGDQPVVAYASPVTASIHLMREPSGLKLKSVLVQDMEGTPLHTAAPREEDNASDRSH